VRAALDDVTDAVEDLAQGVFPPADVFGRQSQIGGDERPFLVTDIGRIGGASIRARILSPSQGQLPNSL
jgi:hypothetical protein